MFFCGDSLTGRLSDFFRACLSIVLKYTLRVPTNYFSFYGFQDVSFLATNAHKNWLITSVSDGRCFMCGQCGKSQWHMDKKVHIKSKSNQIKFICSADMHSKTKQ